MTVTHWINIGKYITNDNLNQLRTKMNGREIQGLIGFENRQMPVWSRVNSQKQLYGREQLEITKNTVGAEYDWVKGRIQMTEK